MDVLSSRILLRSADPGRSRRFYRDELGLAVFREFGDPTDPGMVFFLGGGLLEVSGIEGPRNAQSPTDQAASLWLQVRDLDLEHERLIAVGVPIGRPPRREPWGLIEMWIADPDGVPIVLVQVPDDHPLRIDQRRAR